MSQTEIKSTVPRLFDSVKPYFGWIILSGYAVLIKEIARVSVYIFLGQALDVVVGISETSLERLLIIEGILVLIIGIHGFLAVIGKGGKAAEQGTHNELLQLSGRYAAYYRSQFKVS